MQDPTPKAKNPLGNIFLPTSLNFTFTQFLHLNLLLPPRHKLELSIEKSLRTRSTNTQNSPQLNIPLKRRSHLKKRKKHLSDKPKPWKKCYKILKYLKNSVHYHNFSANTENYSLIEDPIDLIQIENKLISGEYLSAHPLIKDIKKMISQKFAQHCKSPEIFKEIFQFSQLFEKSFKGCMDLSFSQTLVQDLTEKIQTLKSAIKGIQKKTPKMKNLKDRKMTNLEKKQLCSSLKKLNPVNLKKVLKIVKKNPAFNPVELEFDLEKLPNKVLWELEKYIKKCLDGKSNKEKSALPVIFQNKLQTKKFINSVSSSLKNKSEDELPDPILSFDIWDDDFFKLI